MPQIESVSDTSSSASSSPPASSSRHRDLIDNRRSSKLSLTLSRGALSQHSKTELAALLISEERESSKLRKTLLSVVDQLRGEAQRANDAERRALDSAARLRAMEDERRQARREATKASEELRLYKMQLDTAQREILRAQGILESLEAERAQADESAARARSMARKMKEELLVDRAREEGRRQGIREAMAGRRVYVGGDDGERGSIRSRVSSIRNAADDSMLDFGPPIPPPAPIAVNVTPPPPPPAAVPPAPTPAPPPPPTQAEPIVIHTPTPPPPVVASPPPPDIHPVPVYNVPRSPSRADIDLVIPPDTFVPVAGADMSISLPPPHEMSRLVRSPETPYTGLPSSGVPPPPVIHSPRTTMTPPLPVPNVTTRRAHRHRREHSPDSASLASTTISQFDIVTEPGPSRPQSTSTFAPREQKRALSVIPEMPTPSARTEGSLRGSPAGKPATLRGSPAESTRNLAPVPEHATMSAQAMPPVADPPHYVYRRPSFADSTSSSASGPSVAQRSPSLRQSNRASSSSVPDINVEPPSRPGSLTPQQSTPLVPMGTFLTPEDAHRVQTPTQPPPPELPSAPPVPAPTQPVPAPTVPISAGLGPGGTEPIVLAGDQLPPGFVPNASISPSRGAVPLPSARSAPVSTKVPAPASTSTSHRSKRGSAVVPDASLYAGPVTSSSDTDDSSLSSSLSRETLSTPPPRRPVVSTKKPKKTKGPAYQVAPDEPAYPLSPLMQGGPIPGRGLPGMSPATARVPLPPATVTSPRSSGSALSSAAYRTVSPSTVLSSLPAESVPAKGRGKNKKKR